MQYNIYILFDILLISGAYTSRYFCFVVENNYIKLSTFLLSDVHFMYLIISIYYFKEKACACATSLTYSLYGFLLKELNSDTDYLLFFGKVIFCSKYSVYKPCMLFLRTEAYFLNVRGNLWSVLLGTPKTMTSRNLKHRPYDSNKAGS